MDDLISRRDAVSRFSDLLMLEIKGKRLPTWEEVYNAMQDVPSAQPERKHGWWISDLAFYDDEGCPCFVLRCSVCGESYPKSNFCPHCGADMRGEE